MKWYKHDSNANNDAKLKKIVMKYGMEGYGLYWYCLELISQNVEKHNLTFSLEHDSELISMSTTIHQERVQEMMSDFVKWGLFENTDGIITCLKMATRTDEYTQKLIKQAGIVPTLSRQTPDSVPIMSDLIEEKRIEENRTEESNKLPSGNFKQTPHKKIISIYHETLPGCPTVREWTPERQGFLRARWGDDPERQNLDWWQRFFEYVSKSDFLMGKMERPGKPPFLADLEWIVRPSNFVKIIEGKYHRQ